MKDLSDTFLIEDKFGEIRSETKSKVKAYSEVDLKHLKSVDQIPTMVRGPRAAHKQIGR